MTCKEALRRKAGTRQGMLREKSKAEAPQDERTEAHVGGGLSRSSVERAVMAKERRGQLI